MIGPDAGTEIELVPRRSGTLHPKPDLSKGGIGVSVRV
jgi:hypothetical protein